MKDTRFRFIQVCMQRVLRVAWASCRLSVPRDTCSLTFINTMFNYVKCNCGVLKWYQNIILHFLESYFQLSSLYKRASTSIRDGARDGNPVGTSPSKFAKWFRGAIIRWERSNFASTIPVAWLQAATGITIVLWRRHSIAGVEIGCGSLV